MLLKLLTINLVVILIVDMSGFIPNIKRCISKLLTGNKFKTEQFRIRPFDCSYCMTFWCLLIFLFVIKQFDFVNIFYLVIITHFTDVTKQLLLLLKDIAIKAIDTIYDGLQIK